MMVSAVLALSFAVRVAVAQADDESKTEPEGVEMSIPDRGRVRAPELGNNRGWLNTERPLSLAALRGKVVLLDFWTYGCINCIHIIPDLKRLEAKYPNNLVVIGVHSAKFENEKQSDNIRQIILRYEVEHPVVNDADFFICSLTTCARGREVLIARRVTCRQVEAKASMKRLTKARCDAAEFRGRGGGTSTRSTHARTAKGALPLAFTARLWPTRKRSLVIADSNHNRIVIHTNSTDAARHVGRRARRAGRAFDAPLSSPQGLAA